MAELKDPCPVCRRMDGGHDEAIHRTVEKGTKTYPPPKGAPTGMGK